MAFAFITSSSGLGQTAAVDTTGADLIVCALAGDSPSTVVFQDSNGNTWTASSTSGPGNGSIDTYTTVYWCRNPTVGAGHTFKIATTAGGSAIGYMLVMMQAFSGVLASGTFLDAQSGGSTNANTFTSYQAPAIATAQTDQLVVSGFCTGVASTSLTVDSGFTRTSAVAGVASVNYGGAMAYKLRSTAGSDQPTWSWPTFNTGAVRNVSFLSATSGGGGGGAGVLSTAVVHSSGQKIDCTFSSAATVVAADFSVLVDGVPMVVAAVSGSGSSWSLSLGLRWIRVGASVIVTRASVSVTATNSSATNGGQVAYVGRKFGMFLHFNVETFLNIEWSVGASPNDFNPSLNIGACIDQWIAGALSAGMQYLVLTIKHHSGFCLWPTATTTFSIAGSSWYAANGQPDIVKLFVSRVRAAGLGVGLYFSVWDRGFEARTSGWTPTQYTNYTQAQLTEMLSNYGPIDLMWCDGYDWNPAINGSGSGIGYTQVPYASFYNFAKALQPNLQILINNAWGNRNNTDIVSYEVPVLGIVPSNNLIPAESADTIRGDDKWFWKAAAETHKTASTINSTLATIASRRAAFLLNCAPDTTGKLPAKTMQVLAEIGAATAELGAGATLRSTYTAKKVQVTLTSDGTTPRANLTGLKYAFFDRPMPGREGAPAFSGVNGSTNASGVMVIDASGSALTVGQVGWLVVTDSDGTTTQSPAAYETAAAVQLS